MMRRNLALVLLLVLAAPGVQAKEAKRKRLDQMNTTKDRWNELMQSEQLEDDKPKREVIRLPARSSQAPAPSAKPPVKPVTAGRPATTAAMPAQQAQVVRQPASVAPIQAAKPASAFPVAAITFEEYLAENGRNPSLARKIPDAQTAFAEIVGPAVITMPGSESATAANTAGQPGALNGANPAALQNAAAAAAAAGLLPGGGAGAGGYVVPAQPMQQQTTGGPAR